VDGDGFDDFIVGDPLGRLNNGLNQRGVAFVFSGATGAQLFRFDGLADFDSFGSSVAGAGDVNGDGFDDLIVGAEFADPHGSASGLAFVYSGRNGNQLFRINGMAAGDELGNSVAGAGDLDGDGFDDFIVGARFADPNGVQNAGSVFVFSGATGTQIFRFDGSVVGELGFSVAGAGDVDGDGVPDLILGAPSTSVNGNSGAGSAFVFSGRTGAQIWRLDGRFFLDNLGWSVAGAGDVNGDGRPDLIVGAPQASSNGLMSNGYVQVFSGATGAPFFQFNGTEAGALLGFSVAGAGDLDRDGLADIIVGAISASPNGLASAGSAYVFSFAATEPLFFRFDGFAAGDRLGASVAGAGEVHGHTAMIIGAPQINNSGFAVVYTFNPILTTSSETFSVSAGGTIHYLIEFVDSFAGAKYGMLLSARGTGPTLFKGLLIPLQRDSFFVASTKGNTPLQGKNFQGTLDSQGQALARFTAGPGNIPNKLIGRSIFLAAVNKKLDFASVARRIDFTP